MADEDFSISVEDLEQREDEELRLADLAIRNVFIKRVSDVLQKKLSEKRSKEIASQLLDDQSVEEYVRKENWEPEVANVAKEYQGLRDITFLLISAPRSNTCLTIEQDREARKKQLDLFYSIITKHRDRSKCIRVYRCALSYNILRKNLEAFMTEDASKAKKAFIVFNGHGKETGHISLEDEMNEISNSKFIKDVHDIWKVYKKPRDTDVGQMVLPQRISIVLAHCYGFKHEVDGSAKDVIDVVCLTNPNCPKTKFVYKMNSTRNKVQDALHIELTNYARDVMKQDSVESTSSATSITSSTESTSSAMSTSSIENSCSAASSRDSVVSVLDTTTLACMVFCKDTTPTKHMAKQDSGSSDFLGSISKLKFTVKPFVKKIDSISHLIQSSTSSLMGMSLGGSCEQLRETPKSKRKKLKRQEEVTSHDGALTHLVRSATEALVPSTSQQLVTAQVRSRSKPVESPSTIRKKANTDKNVKKTPVGGISAMVGLSASLGQLIQHVNIEEEDTDV